MDTQRHKGNAPTPKLGKHEQATLNISARTRATLRPIKSMAQALTNTKGRSRLQRQMRNKIKASRTRA